MTYLDSHFGQSQRHWQPSGFITNLDRFLPHTNTATLLTGRIYFTGGLVVPAGFTVNNISYVAGDTAGATLTHTWFCIVSKDLATIIAKTADDTSAAWSAQTEKRLALSSTWTPTTDTPCYLGICVVGTTTPSIMGFGVRAQSINSTTGSTDLLHSTPPSVYTPASSFTDPSSFTTVPSPLTGSDRLHLAWVS